MAENLSSDDGADTEAGRTHNLTEQKEIIAKAVAEIISLETERATIGESIADVRLRVKNLNVKMADFNAVMRLYKLEGDDRNSAIDSIRLCCEALGVGTQGDLFPSTEETGATA